MRSFAESRFRFAVCATLTFFLACHATKAAEPLPQTPPTAATETSKSFQTLDGFRMTLLAAEPMVTDPVAMCYDADGRCYVAEMNDYPYTDKANHQPMQENPTDQAIGKIRLLEDVDGDGVFDKATVFADRLSWPTGVVPWKGGVYVTAAPDVWYFKDTDGDGKADLKQQVLTGYRKYNVQAAVNNPIWGLDHKLYIASAGNGGKLYRPAAGTEQAAGPEHGVDLGRRDLRLDPAGGNRFEVISGGIQFGNSFDDWGNRFLGNNSRPVYHVVMPLNALARNPSLPTRRTAQLCTQAEAPIQLFPLTGIEGWRLQRYKDRQHVPRKGYKPPRSVAPGEPSSPTSSSGPVVYRGDAYPAAYHGSIFVPEPCYNLLYHLDVQPYGATFTVTKPAISANADMVASSDVWFRPTNFVNAPDGCLHVADLYRETIEHPWSLPEAFHARMDLERGRDRGRIYRLQPPGYQHRPAPKLSRASSADLVSLLEHPNAWHRETAHRLLFERQDRSVAAELRRLVRESRQPLGRLHALWTLHGLGVLRGDDLRIGFADASAGVRAQAVVLATAWVSEHPNQTALFDRVAALATDPDAAVRFQTALALAASKSAAASRALAEIARRDVDDSWTRLAVLSSSVPHAATIFADLLADGDFTASAASGEFLGSLARTVGASHEAGESAALITRLADRERFDHLAVQIVTGLARGLRGSKSNLAMAVANSDAGQAYLDTLFARARDRAADLNLSVSERTAAITLLRDAPYEETSDLLRSLLDATELEAIQSAAVATISSAGGRRPEVGDHLLEGWDGYSGQLRNQVVQLLLSRVERLNAFFDSIEAGKVQPYQLGVTRQELLLSHADPEIASRAKQLFATAESRKQVLQRYQSVADFDGDTVRGQQVYKKVCSACHKFYDQGNADLAPNLAAVAGWDSQRLVTNILDPNREVAPEYMEYIVLTESGSVFTGRIVNESSSGITLRSADNITRDIARDEIAELRNSGRSLMPSSLEEVLPPQAMSDLIAFLRDPAAGKATPE
jgi:putative membrane-bound dehydrogenase-like protein